MPNNETFPFSARKRLIVVAISACFSTAPAWANPTGPQVVNGSASVAQAGKLLTVTNSNGAIINWNTFSIGASETTRFNQASAASGVLNRVLANDPSVLLGTLSSNGKVWLVNPAGILVGQGARIDVAGFIASTLNVKNEDFLAGRLNFQFTPNAGKVENYGQITTPSGGSVYLVAPNVENHGTITAPEGEVILVAGQRVELLDTGTPGVKVEVVGAEGNATNLGSIVSEAGRIGIAGVLVKNSGTLNASSLVKQGGRIFLKASQDAYVDGAGRIVATGTKGGSIEVLGNRVAVMDQAQLDASGTNGGGKVLVGGDYQGKNPEVQNAQATYFGPEASIKADAAQSGDGGKVIVWADDTTRAHGTISAKGGAQSGNGGLVETSGHHLETAGIRVDASAPQGKAGSWLLDPNDVQIVDGTGTNANITPSGGIWNTSSDSAVVYGGNIATALNGGTSVEIRTGTQPSNTQYGDIAMSVVTLDVTPANDTSLILKAHRSIAITNSSVSSTGRKLGVTLNAHYLNDTAPGNVEITDSSINTNGGNITIGGGSDPTATSAVGIGTATHSDKVGIYLNGATLNAGVGSISLRGTGVEGTYAAQGIYVTNGTVIKTIGAGTITLNGTGGANGGWGGDDNDGVRLGTNSAISSVDGAIAITGTGGANSGSYSYGVYIHNGATVASTGIGTITLIGTGGGGAETNSNAGIRISASDGDTRISSASGAISMTAVGGYDGQGLEIVNGAVVQSKSGEIKLKGTGGSDGSGGYLYGVRFDDGARVNSISGNIKIEGTGGYSDGNNVGILVADPGTQIASVSGNIRLEGTGAGYGGGNRGIRIESGAVVESTGTGTGIGSVTLIGESSHDGTGGHQGILIIDGGSKVASVDGAIELIGTSYGQQGSASGIRIESGGAVEATGIGSITMTGYAADATSGGKGPGIYIKDSGTLVRAKHGDIHLTGFGALGQSDSNNHGVFLEGGAEVRTEGFGSIVIEGTPGNGSDFGILTSGATIAASAGDVTLSSLDATLSSPYGGVYIGGNVQGVNLTVNNDLTLSGDPVLKARDHAQFGTITGIDGYGVKVVAGSIEAGSITTSGISSATGAISLTANAGSITTGRLQTSLTDPESSGYSTGAVMLKALDNVSTGAIDTSIFSTLGNGTGNAGPVSVVAQRGSIVTGNINTSSIATGAPTSAGSGGDVFMSAGTWISVDTSPTDTGTGTIVTSSEATGDGVNPVLTAGGGNVTLYANGGDVTTGAIDTGSRIFAGSSTSSAGSAGSIIVRASDNVLVNGDIKADAINDYGWDSGNSNGGEISLYALGGTLTVDGKISTSTSNAGTGGNVTLYSIDDATVYGSVVYGSTFFGLSQSDQDGLIYGYGEGNIGQKITIIGNGDVFSGIAPNGDYISKSATGITVASSSPTARNIVLDAASGDIVVNDSVSAGSSNAGWVSMRAANGNITVGTPPSDPYAIKTYGGDILLRAIGSGTSGKILGSGSLVADGDSTNTNGGHIRLIADGNIGDVGAGFSGSISANGYSVLGSRAVGGTILIQSRFGSINLTGSYLRANGAGYGGHGGSIEIALGNAYGGVVLGGGTNGSIALGVMDSIPAPSIEANGTAGGNGPNGNVDNGNVGQNGGDGGRGGSIRISTALSNTGGGVTYYGGSISGISAYGGLGGDGGYAGPSGYAGGHGGAGGLGGAITIEAGKGGSILVKAASLVANGGDGGYGGWGSGGSLGAGGAGGTGGRGGDAGTITLQSIGSTISGDVVVSLSSVDANGGSGGYGYNGGAGASSAMGGIGGWGGDGGVGGKITLQSTGSVTSGKVEVSSSSVNANGGSGGDGDNGGQGGDGNSSGASGGAGGIGGRGGDGGHGGYITLKSTGSTDNGLGVLVSSSSLNAYGGSGGDGDRGGGGGYGYDSPGSGGAGGIGGSGGKGGDGGTIVLQTTIGNVTVSSSSSVNAYGGSSGYGDHGGDGGYGYGGGYVGGAGGRGGRGGNGGAGGSITLQSDGPTTSGKVEVSSSSSLNASGGSGGYGGYGGAGGDGGYNNSAGGGAGGAGGIGGNGGDGGAGGSITLESMGSTTNGGVLVSFASLDANGGSGRDGGKGGGGGDGYHGDSSSYAGGSGGNGGNSGNGGRGGDGGFIVLQTASGTVTVTSTIVNAFGGSGGEGGNSGYGGGNGGDGGDGVNGSGYYGAGGSGGNGGHGGSGGSGGLGGIVTIESTGSIGGSVTLSLSSINADGGIGGIGGLGGNGGSGGNGYGSYSAGVGGTGGNGASGGQGGAGGKVEIFGTGTGSSITLGSGTSIAAGAGAGGIGGAGGYDGDGFPSGLAGIDGLDGSAFALDASSNALISAKGSFINNAGSGVLSVGTAGRWLIYSGETLPTNFSSQRGGLVYDFKQYNTSYGGTVLGTGNGFLYSLAPTLTPVLSGSFTRTYDSGTSATAGLAGSTFGVTTIDGDTVLFTNPTSATYDTKNAGSRTVSATGFSIDSNSPTSSTGKKVYGYLLPGTTVTATGLINKAAIANVTGIGASNKIYDGGTSATPVTVVAGFTNMFAGDILTVGAATGAFSDKNVATGKTVNVSGIALGGLDAGNYTLTSTTATTTADITVRDKSTWIGGASGDWSVASNWDAIPDLSNVLAVTAPAGTSVTYDTAAGTTNLASLTASGLAIAGGSLNIANNLKLSSSFSQTGGTLGFGTAAIADITQASGNLTMPGATLASLSLAAPSGAITQSGAIVATDLITKSQTGTTLTDAGNKVANFSASNTGSGNVAFTNAAELTIGGITNSGGNITVDNTGAVTTTGAVSAPAGAVSILAHSPLTIGTGGVSASGNIALTAGETPALTDILTLNGVVESTGGGAITLLAGDDLTQNANVTTAGGAVSATSQIGNIGMASGVVTNAGGGSIGYEATGGNIVLASLDAGVGDISLGAGRDINSVSGFTGANLIGDKAVIVAGGNASFSTRVRLLDVSVGGTFSIFDLITGTLMTNVPTLTDTSLPALDQVLSSINDTTQREPGQTRIELPPQTGTGSDDSDSQFQSGGSHTIGGTQGAFGGGDEEGDDKSAKSDDQKSDDDKKEGGSSGKKDDKSGPKKLATCGGSEK